MSDANIAPGDGVHPGDPVKVDRYTKGARLNHWITAEAHPCAGSWFAAVSAICVWIVHVYAAIWVRGTISAMTRGQVTGGWAWRHHRKWLRDLVTRH